MNGLNFLKTRKTFRRVVRLGVVALAAFLICGMGKVATAKTLLGDFLEERDIEVTASASLDFYNKYVWRGMLLDDDCVLQPGFTISALGFEGGFWGSWDLQNDDGLNSDEVDGWIGYSYEIEGVTLSVGHTWYDFPETDTYSKELYLGVAVDTFLSPSVTWYHDYAEEASGGADGENVVLGINHSITLNEEYGLSLDLSAEAGYNKGFFISGVGGHYMLNAGITIPLTENLAAFPNVGYSVPLGDLEDESDGNYKEQTYAGVALALSF